MRGSIPFVLALVSSAFLAACGVSTNSMTAVGGVPMSLTIRDTPPTGVAVLFFEASITGASLQPSDSSKPAVSVLSAPVEVEFGHLQTDTAFLSLANVPPDAYGSIRLTFGRALPDHGGRQFGVWDQAGFQPEFFHTERPFHQPDSHHRQRDPQTSFGRSARNGKAG